jgi:predicted dehydrogenase
MSAHPQPPGHVLLPPPRRRLRLGFVGGGKGAFIGQVHAMGARLSNRWEVVAGALSSSPETALRSGHDWLLAQDRIYPDYRTMAETERDRPDGIDAVAIVTPNHLHAPVALAFMRCGIDVICDKPLCNSMQEAAALRDAQRETGLVFGVSYVYASHAMVRQIREMVRDGAVGRIRQIHVEYFQEWALDPASSSEKGGAWRMDPARSGASFTTADIGTHAHHLACFASGLEMQALRADFHVSGAAKPLEDTCFMQTRFEGDVPGTLMVSQAAAGTHCGLRLRIFGDLACLEWNQETPEHVTLSPAKAPSQRFLRGEDAGIGQAARRVTRMPRGHPEGFADAWATLYTEFAVAVEARRDGRTLPDGLLGLPSLRDGIAGVKFVLAAVESNAAGGTWNDCRR